VRRVRTTAVAAGAMLDLSTVPVARMTDVSQAYVDEFREFAGLRPPATIQLVGDANAFIQRMRGDEFCALVDNTLLRSGDRALGFRFGAAIGGRGFGLLGVATAAAPSLLQSLQSLLRWEPLTSTLGRASLQHCGTQVRVLWTPAPGISCAVIEGVLAGWIAFSRFLVGEAMLLSAVEVCHANEGHKADAEALLGCPVIFGATQNAVTFPLEILDARPRYADAVLYARLAGWLDDCVRVIGQPQESPLLQVSGIILQGLAWGESAEDRIAERLGLARRTLQRRLGEAGIQFRRLRELVRASLAVSQLSTGAGRFIDIAQRIGFEEQATFSRAVRQWTGRSPREFSRIFADGYGNLRRDGGI
jgi:AraC-like DNA-binding protein